MKFGRYFVETIQHHYYFSNMVRGRPSRGPRLQVSLGGAYVVATCSIGGMWGFDQGVTAATNVINDYKHNSRHPVASLLGTACGVLIIPICTAMGGALGPFVTPCYLVWKMTQK